MGVKQMRKVNISQITEKESSSPSGKYHSFGRHVSIALGRIPNSDSKASSHPFDLELCRIPSGAALCPFHAHSAQWELYLVISGTGKIRDKDGFHELTPGDAVVFPPHEPHQICNDGKDDLVFYIIADDPPGEACYYPDSDKWNVPSHGKRTILKGQEVDYFAGEE